jgi:diguanylate cyclase (GGDEF)-like protein
LLTQVLSLAYPVSDLVLLTALLKLIYRRSEAENPAPLFLLAAGAGVQIVTDAIYGRMALLDTYTGTGLLDLGWLISYLLMGMAGVWQAVTVPATAPTQQSTLPAETPHKPNTWLTYFPYLWAAGAYLLLVFDHTHESPVDYLFMTGGVGIVIGLVFVRQVLTLIENSRLFDQFRGAMDRVQGQTAELQQVNQELQQEIEERKRAEEQLAFDSLHDALTGLPNRVLFMDRIQHAMEFTKRREQYGFTVVFLDLDQFKLVNDSLGHSEGDQLLIAIAQRLRLCMRSSDTVARLGGDEFVILLDDVQELPDVLTAAERIHHRLKDPYDLGEQKIYITASFGIVAGAIGYARPEEILRDADIAMYHAKAQGKARYEIFTPQLRDQAISRLEVKNDLQVALERGELLLNYQPIFDLQHSGMVGCEALIRWQHPARGLIKPSEFIPLAEEVGLINPIGQWVLREACRQMREWQESFPRYPALTVSVNVSADQFNQQDFAGQIRQVLQETGLDGRCLKLEITEGIFLRKSERIIAIIRELNTLGVEFQIDDFGTGYSSLSYLQDYPIQAVKIDRSFIEKMRTSKSSEIVRSIIAMAHELSMTTIAEGIEKDIELEYLKKYACDAGQGYLLHHPVDKIGIERLLREVSTAAKTQPVRWIADQTGA